MADRSGKSSGTTTFIIRMRDESALPDSSNASVRERPPPSASRSTKLRAPMRGDS